MTDVLEERLFKDFSALIASVSDPEAFLNVLTTTATRILAVKACSLILRQENEGTLYFHITAGSGEEDVKKFELAEGEGIVGWVIEHGEPVLAPDVKLDHRWSPRVSESIGVNVKSIACAPLEVEGRVIGALEIIDRLDGLPLDEKDLRFLSAFSEIAVAALHKMGKLGRAEREIKSLKEKLRGGCKIIGSSAPLMASMESCRKVAVSKTTTLLTGESGTGKELFARLIHDLSPRSDKQLVCVNCGALPEGLLERELFGHEKGAFTGAIGMSPGLFETADGGTIFLDEIGEVIPALQVKLLRVLQEGAFMRIGGQELIKVDVRIVAATNKDLKKMVEEKKFREDLYYRLNVIEIKLPPLRDRREDIPLLVECFLGKISEKMNRRKKGITESAMMALINADWPGNIRQLENSIERAFIMSESETIEVKDLQPEIASAGGAIHDHGVVYIGQTLKTAQNEFRKQYISQVLRQHGSSQVKTARALGVQRTYLSRLIRELGIKEKETLSESG